MKKRNLTGKTIVITGGSSGIGLELAKRLATKNTVIAVGRDPQKLAGIAEFVSATYAMDISDLIERKEFFDWLIENYPAFDTLINNAGWTSLHAMANVQSDVPDYALELKHNLEAHIGMTLNALPLLKTQHHSSIINVTTGLVYNPKSIMPFYCAAKAGLHSFTKSLRVQLANSNIEVIEAMPPLVNTEFHKNGLPETVKALTADKAVESLVQGWERGHQEIRIGLSRMAYFLSRFAPSLGLKVVNK